MVDQLTEDQIIEYKECFSLYDKNGDGTIPVKDLGVLLRSLGYNTTEIGLEDKINDVDQNWNGIIKFPDFLTLVARSGCNCGREFEVEISEAFLAFDKEKTGFIQYSEAKVVLNSFGEKLSDDEIEEMFVEAKVDNQEKLNYREFIKNMMSN